MDRNKIQMWLIMEKTSFTRRAGISISSKQKSRLFNFVITGFNIFSRFTKSDLLVVASKWSFKLSNLSANFNKLSWSFASFKGKISPQLSLAILASFEFKFGNFLSTLLATVCFALRDLKLFLRTTQEFRFWYFQQFKPKPQQKY